MGGGLLRGHGGARSLHSGLLGDGRQLLEEDPEERLLGGVHDPQCDTGAVNDSRDFETLVAP